MDAYKYPYYYAIISNPIDFKSMKKTKVAMDLYLPHTNPLAGRSLEDIDLMMRSNAHTYNNKGDGKI
jgi:hypothetical protein